MVLVMPIGAQKQTSRKARDSLREEVVSLQNPLRVSRRAASTDSRVARELACTQLLLITAVVSTLGVAIATLVRLDNLEDINAFLMDAMSNAQAAASTSAQLVYSSLVARDHHRNGTLSAASGKAPNLSQSTSPGSPVYAAFCVLQPCVCAANVLLLASIGFAGVWPVIADASADDRNCEQEREANHGSSRSCAAVFACLLDVESPQVVLESVRKALGVKQLACVVISYNTSDAADVADTVAKLKQLDPESGRLRVLYNPDSASKAANLNAAVKILAAHDLALVLDADHHIDDAFVAKIVSQMLAEPTGTVCVQASVLVRGDSRWETCLCALSWYFFSLILPTFEFLSGTCMFVGAGAVWRSSALVELGGFSTRFVAEDDDLSMRAIRAGYNIRSCPTAELTELAPASAAAFLQQRLRWTFGYEQSMNAHLLGLARERPWALLQRLYAWYSYLLVFAGISTSVLAVASVRSGDLSIDELAERSVLADVALAPAALLVVAAVAAALKRNGNKRFWQTWFCFPVTFFYGFAQALLFLCARARLLFTVCIAFEWRVTRRNVRA